MVGLRLDVAVSATPGTLQRKQARQHKYNTGNLHGKKKKKKAPWPEIDYPLCITANL